jgi:probable phosphoglycerate mutase
MAGSLNFRARAPEHDERAVTTFLLLRHGETLWNRAGRLQGWRDSPLSTAGRAQARALAERIATERVDHLLTSDLGRTRDTAAVIAARLGLSAVADPRLRERSYGELEGKTWVEIERDDPATYERLAQRDAGFVVPGGESAVQFRDRVVAAIDDLARQHRNVVLAVVTHGGVLGMVYRHTYRIPLELPRTYSVPNAGVSRVTVSSANWTIEVWGDVAHVSGMALDDE